MDLRLQHLCIDLDGKRFDLCCNFNVLADVEEMHGGLGPLLRSPSALHSVRVFLSCMMNDYAERMGWQERYTPRQAGRLLPTQPKEMNAAVQNIMDLVFSAVRPDDDPADPPEKDAEKNGETRQAPATE